MIDLAKCKVIGYGFNPFMCPDCAGPKFKEIHTKVYDVSILPYTQHCWGCGMCMIKGTFVRYGKNGPTNIGLDLYEPNGFTNNDMRSFWDEKDIAIIKGGSNV